MYIINFNFFILLIILYKFYFMYISQTNHKIFSRMPGFPEIPVREKIPGKHFPDGKFPEINN